MMPQIEVDFPRTTLAAFLELRFADGSAMRNEFRDSKLNPPIQDELFEPALDPGYKVVEPFEEIEPSNTH
jgi:outer membrane lipoprotein-sorting protein